MDQDTKDLYDHIIGQYRQDADRLKYALARANAQAAIKDQIIKDLQGGIEDQALVPDAPKPSPPNAS